MPILLSPAKTLVPPAPRSETPAPVRWLTCANAKHLSLFFRQMHALLHAGMSLGPALDAMTSRAPDRALKRAASEMARRTGAGVPWSEALRAFPELFSPLAMALISAGEAGGSLPAACRRLADDYENEYTLQQEIKRGTWYPKLLVFFSTVIVPLPIHLAVCPIDITFGMGSQIAILGGIWLVWKIAKLLWRFLAPSTRLNLDRMRLKLPIVGRTVRALALAKFCSLLGSLHAAGVPLSRALRLAADGCGNAFLAASIRRAVLAVEGGHTLTESLAATGEFSGLVLQMFSTGEKAGDLDGPLQSVAEFLEGDGQTALKQSVTAGCLVAFLLAALKIGVQVVQFWFGYAGV